MRPSQRTGLPYKRASGLLKPRRYFEFSPREREEERIKEKGTVRCVRLGDLSDLNVITVSDSLQQKYTWNGARVQEEESRSL